MATFIHFAPEKALRSVRRTGLRAEATVVGVPGGVFALPAGPEFSLSHQWIAELRRWGRHTPWAVYFRVPDDEPVWVGPYTGPHRETSAGEAAALFFARGSDVGLGRESRLGYEVIVPRAVRPAEIHRIRRLTKALGWRRRPGGMPVRVPETDDQSLERMLGTFPPAAAALGAAALGRVRALLPGAVELVSGSPTKLEVRFAPVMREYTVILAVEVTEEGVAVRFAEGASLPDPHRLLRGSGRERRMELRGAADLDHRGFAPLVSGAAAFAMHPVRPGRPRRIRVASVFW